MHAPLIGISAKREEGTLSKIVLPEYYIRAVQRAGGIPIIFPVGLDEAGVSGACAQVDGLLLSGGGDVDPTRFNGRPHNRVSGVDLQRDLLEIQMVQIARNRGIPLLGICRGLQVINIAHGGTLFTDLSDQREDRSIGHAAKEFGRLVHAVEVLPETRLSMITRQTALTVNSLHHQGIDQLGAGLKVSAIAPDGLVEGIEAQDGHYLVGVQWHPEALTDDPGSQAIFASLVDAAIDYHGGS